MPLFNKANTSLNLEMLETRETPAAGNVSVNLVQNEWRIIGDFNPNAVTLTRLTNGLIRVTGGPSDGGTTTINKQRFVDITPNRVVSISLGDGNDKLTLQGASNNRLRFENALNISMGSDVDTVNATHIYVGGTTRLDMGAGSLKSGDERAQLHAVDVGNLNYRSDRSVGSNYFGMTSSAVRGNLAIAGGSASNSVNLASLRIAGLLSAHMGHENSSTLMQDSFALASVVAGGIQVDMGGGRASVRFTKVETNTIHVVCNSYSSDQIVVSDTKARHARFDGGSGSNDRITGTRNHFGQLELVSIERKDWY